jgi:NAD(P)-dependent dehydrogenase (short-subunit alcohol dehydrogenase family)
MQELYAARVPMRRAGTPEEIAAVIVFLTTDDASYITGQNIAVDGGLIATTGAPDNIEYYSKLMGVAS